MLTDLEELQKAQQELKKMGQEFRQIPVMMVSEGAQKPLSSSPATISSGQDFSLDPAEPEVAVPIVTSEEKVG